MSLNKNNLKLIKPYLYEISKDFRPDMRVAGRFYEDEKNLDKVFEDKSLEQLINATTIPGIVKYAIAMPDMHEGYGVPIGCVFATKAPEGLISPGAVGYDINCGVRLLRSSLKAIDIKSQIERLTQGIYEAVPSGVGRGGAINLDYEALKRVLKNGARHLVEKGYGEKEDLEHIEEKGEMSEADPTVVSQRALSRGRDQLGTLGAGNHFLEIQRVEKIFDREIAKVFGLFEGQVTFMIHTGSRGLGHQVAGDYMRMMIGTMTKFKLKLPDRELAGAPFGSQEGRNYFAAMSAAANYAFANRQLIAHRIREVVKKIIAQDIKLDIVYDIAHNMAKLEKGRFSQIDKQICTDMIVHRKGATRAFPPGHEAIPQDYKKVGQPVIIPGSMGTASYVLVGTTQAYEETFGSTCHGAGRQMSRHRAIQSMRGEDIKRRLNEKGIIIKAGSVQGIAEEAPGAYKDIEQVINVVEAAGISKKVARLVPLAVIKG